MSTARVGFTYALIAFLFWGVAPLYFAVMDYIGAVEIVLHRSVWSCVFLGIWISIAARWSSVREILASPKKLITVLVTGPLIAVNWGVFVWAIEMDRLADASLGYFLNPLMFILGGMLVFGERLSRVQWIAVAIAAVGVVYLTIQVAEAVWIALTLAGTFTAFGLARKWADIPPTGGLFVETVGMLPLVVLALFFWPQLNHAFDGWTFGGTMFDTAMLVGVGIITVLPLVWFNEGAKRLAYKYIGIMQFIAPSIMFVLALVVLGEDMQREKLYAFFAIWTALMLFVGEQFWPKANGKGQ